MSARCRTLSEPAVGILVLSLLVGGCGRTSPFGAIIGDGGLADGPVPLDGPRRDVSLDVGPRLSDGPPTDRSLTDGRPLPDGRPPPPDGPLPADIGPCAPGCQQLCELVANKCNLMPWGACLGQCPWADDVHLCLVNSYCFPTSGIHPCTVVESCLDNPPPPPQLPDLTVQDLTASVLGNGSTVRYRVRVCNVGSGNAGATQVHVYYHRSNAPAGGQPGDQSASVPQLAPGQCVSRNLFRTGTPAGTYTSWAQIDPLNVVTETDESNNTAGPIAVTVGPPMADCFTTCSFAIQCGLFAQDELLRCLNWCSGLTLSQHACLDAAHKAGSCAQFEQCNTPPPPPPPPPPGVCPDLCNFLIHTCHLLPPDQYWTCIGACQNLTPDKLACAQTARDNDQCMQLVTCMF